MHTCNSSPDLLRFKMYFITWNVCLLAQLYPSLCNPLDYSPPVEIFRQEYWSGLPFPSSTWNVWALLLFPFNLCLWSINEMRNSQILLFVRNISTCIGVRDSQKTDNLLGEGNFLKVVSVKENKNLANTCFHFSEHGTFRDDMSMCWHLEKWMQCYQMEEKWPVIKTTTLKGTAQGTIRREVKWKDGLCCHCKSSMVCLFFLVYGTESSVQAWSMALMKDHGFKVCTFIPTSQHI